MMAVTSSSFPPPPSKAHFGHAVTKPSSSQARQSSRQFCACRLTRSAPGSHLRRAAVPVQG